MLKLQTSLFIIFLINFPVLFAEPACIEGETRQGYVSYLRNIEKNKVLFCINHTEQSCFVLDTETGKFNQYKNIINSEGNPLYESSDPYQYTFQKNGIEACKSSRKCEIITWPNYQVEPDLIGQSSNIISINASETFYLINDTMNEKKIIILKSFRDHKTVATIKESDPEILYMHGEFIKDTIVVQTAKCAGPCTTGKLYSGRTGKMLAFAGGHKDFNLDGTNFLITDNETVMLNEGYGGKVVFQNLSSGKILSTIDMKDHLPKSEEGNVIEEPNMNAMIKLTDNNVLLLYNSLLAGTVFVVDTKLKKITKKFILPLCQKK